MKFLKGSRGEFEKLKDESSWEDKADITQRQMAEVFGDKNLSFLMGSGCSSLRNGHDELGISTMTFLVEEFQSLLATGTIGAYQYDFESAKLVKVSA